MIGRRQWGQPAVSGKWSNRLLSLPRYKTQHYQDDALCLDCTTQAGYAAWKSQAVPRSLVRWRSGRVRERTLERPADADLSPTSPAGNAGGTLAVRTGAVVRSGLAMADPIRRDAWGDFVAGGNGALWRGQGRRCRARAARSSGSRKAGAAIEISARARSARSRPCSAATPYSVTT